MAAEGKMKKKTREAAFKKQLALEREARAAKLASSSSASSISSKAKTKSKPASKAAKLSAASKSNSDKKRRSKHEAEHKVSSFRYKSFNDRLANVQLDRLTSSSSKLAAGLDPLNGEFYNSYSNQSQGHSAVKRRRLDLDNLTEQDHTDSLYTTQFGTALATWRELNLSSPFVNFLRIALPKAQSLPLLLHHRDELVDALIGLLSPAHGPTHASANAGVAAVSSGAQHAYEPALDLLPRLAADLGGGIEFAPVFARSLRAVLRIAGECNRSWTDGDEVLAADLVEKAFASATGLLKVLAPWALGDGKEAESTRADIWEIFRGLIGYQETGTVASLDDDDIDGAEDGNDEEEVAICNQEPDDGTHDPQEEAHYESSAQPESTFVESTDDASVPVETGLPPHKKANPAFRRVSPHVQRFAAEALAHLVRTSVSLHVNSKGQAQPSPLSQNSVSVPTRARELALLMLHDLADVLQRAATVQKAGAGNAAGALTVKAAEKAQRHCVMFARGIAGAWSEACKSTDHHLHGDTPTILSALLQRDESRSSSKLDSSRISTLEKARSLVGRLLLTNLVHYSKAAHFGDVLHLILGLVKQGLRPYAEETGQVEMDVDDDDVEKQNAEEQLREDMALLSICVGVRKGSRIEDAKKTSLFALLPPLASLLTLLDRRHVDSSGSQTIQLHTTLIAFIALLIPIGRMQDQLSAVPRFLNSISAAETASKSDAYGILTKADAEVPSYKSFNAIIAALAQPTVDWSGFKQFALPSVLKHITTCLSSSAASASVMAARTFHLLAMLKDRGQLDDLVGQAPSPASAQFMRSVSKHIKAMMQLGKEVLQRSTSLAETELADLLDAARFAPLLARHDPEVITQLEALVALMVAAATTQPLFVEPLRTTLDSLAQGVERLEFGGASSKRISALVAVRGNPDYLPIVFSLLTLDSPSRSMLLSSIRRLAGAMAGHGVALPSSFTAVVTFEALRPFIMSQDTQLRHAALDLLLTCSTNRGDYIAINKTLEEVRDIEAIPLAVATVRNRTIKTRALGRSLLSEGGDQEGTPADVQELRARIIIDVIVSSLKLNFKPIWGESIAALVDVAQRFPELVWTCGFAELEFHFNSSTIDAPEELSQVSESSQAVLGARIADLRLIPVSLPQLHAAYTEKTWTDPVLDNRHSEILEVCTDALQPSVASSRSSATAIERLSVVNYKLQLLHLTADIPAQVQKHNAHFISLFLKSKDELVQGNLRDDVGSSSDLCARDRQERLSAFLKVFAKLHNPKSLHRSSDLYATFLALCASRDTQVQRLALQCILTWKDPSHISYQETLTNFLEQSKQRDELTNFDLTPDTGSVQPSHRATLLPLIIHLFYGQMMSTKARTNSVRTAMLVSLARSHAEELKALFDLMLASLDESPDEQSLEFEPSQTAPSATAKQQRGFLAFLEQVIKHLGFRIGPAWDRVMRVLLNIAIHANRFAGVHPGSEGTRSREIRQDALKRLNEVFQIPAQKFLWGTFRPIIFKELVSPRLYSMQKDSVEAPSALQELFVTWSRDATLLDWLDFNPELLPSLFACLSSENIKDPVTDRIVAVVENVAHLANSESTDDNSPATDSKAVRLLSSLSSSFIGNAAQWCHRGSIDGVNRGYLLRRMIGVLVTLSRDFSGDESDARLLFDSLVALYARGALRGNEGVKEKVLRILSELLDRVPQAVSDGAVAPAGSFLAFVCDQMASSREANLRKELSHLLSRWAEMQAPIHRVSGWLSAINAYHPRRIEEPDFERRLSGFDAISSVAMSGLHIFELQLLLSNLAFFLQDPDELAIRSQSSHLFALFIKTFFASQDGTSQARQLFSAYVLPSIKRALRSPSELVRREGARLLSTAVADSSHMQNLKDLRPLLAAGDEEASFFENVYHIQLHRRIRAVHRLAEQAQQRLFPNGAIQEYLLPLTEQILSEGIKNGLDHNLVTEAIRCVGCLARNLRWGAYNALLSRYLRQVKDRSVEEKPSVRAVLSILENFDFDLGVDTIEADDSNTTSSTLSAVKTSLIPTLLSHLNKDDNADDHVRLPIAMGVVFVVRRLPARDQRGFVFQLFRALANVLKAKAQETRDLGREMLLKVQSALGPTSLNIALQELRRTLTRTSQKAVLAFVLHAMLVQAANQPEEVCLDSTFMKDASEIALQDLFGQVAEDRITATGKLKAREMKQCKSLDTVEHLARLGGSPTLRDLFAALQDVMAQELPAVSTSLDQVFRRLGAGLSFNREISNSELLSLCHALIAQRSALVKGGSKESEPSIAALVPLVLRKRKDVEGDNSASSNTFSHRVHHFVILGLDLLLIGLKKAKFDLHSDEEVSRLNALVGPVGNVLHAQDSTVVSASLKTMIELVKTDLPAVRTGSGLLTKQLMDIMQRNGGLHSELSQSALKVVSALLREIRDAKLPEKDIGLLLEWMRSDIEEPSVQSSLFTLLRVLLSNRIMSPAVYDVMDKIANVMITSQSAQVREVCRSLYLQFMLDYPQGKGRLRNQLSFLASNLTYTFESGRLSVLELLRAIIAKFDRGALQTFSDTLFVGLVMSVANDDSEQCRSQARNLLRTLLRASDSTTAERNMMLIRGWADKSEKPGLCKVGMQMYTIASEAVVSTEGEPQWLSEAVDLAKKAISSLAAASHSSGDSADASAEAMLLLRTAAGVHEIRLPSLLELGGSDLWVAILADLLSVDRRLSISASSLLGDVLDSARESETDSTGKITEQQHVVFATHRIVKAVVSEELTEQLSLQLQRCLVASALLLQQDVNVVQDMSEPNSVEEGGNDDDESASEGDGDGTRASPLSWWFSRLSFTLRSRVTAWSRFGADKVVMSRQIICLLKSFQSVATTFSEDRLSPFLPHILNPLNRFLDETIFMTGDDEHALAVRAAAEFLQDQLREKVGSSKYATVFSSVRQKALEKRKERKTAQLLEGITNPEAALHRKAAKNASKHAARKRKGQYHKDSKIRTKPIKHR
ncbi:hypothetical protein K437DRAFT_233377 [Tilletiaria anomala UBC 951]|uniref:Uncharacterized protein n=1 Tax=Tilletiaria anomala (strain ATCC 24038 / CBS 436.72 / UBC 951) TaxID=1037660 RepID=A0A066WL77_TILAU|nr:uncharacterized protein K437DRAFT_233377 [Tilletiaria anomala UBC 951]KDN51355.1 hypothetical protein K437DRAFT_233377 [Tilletiaria anomala UBC 951]